MSYANWFGLAALVISLAGCATGGIKQDETEDPRNIVEKRVQLRWDALIKGDLDTAYNYLTPGVRGTVPLAKFKSILRPGMWNSVKVDSVNCEQDRCKVAILLDYTYKGINTITPQNEIWLKVDGEWWYSAK